ncbi:two-component sensor histidine kinase [Clostridium polyendosporum]|uniref:histidine kinase n=1 Tax=Clostridium polyendosporum TaxID=69208 RepID=A0A919RXP7_9CLOT|nr:ATP-binding protein [Clostridium polyendosporum]GIM27355.1 two-component sensor histidine kinase [Clostridium polyendosporum]
MFNRNRLRLLAANITVFVIIFSIFSFIIYSYIRSNQYVRVDKELIISKKLFNKVSSNLEIFIPVANPRVIAVIRNERGELIQGGHISGFYKTYERKLRPKKFNEIFDVNLENYSFRSIAFPVKIEDKTFTVQLLANTNAERDVLKNLLNILVLGGIIILLISIGASWYIADKSMIPILNSWKKQREFVENASHELRTPLTIIQSRLEMLLKYPNSKIIDKIENISPALSETRRISKMVSDLLTLARADSNTTEVEKKKTNMTQLISKIIEPYIELGEMQNKNIVFEALDDMKLFCDEGRIHQLLVILLDNAIKYTEEGATIIVKSFIKDNKYIINVEDNGIGVKAENKEKIFERFFREDKARSRESGGSGLGLSIAQWIVNKHNGTIKCYANSPKGTIIKVSLPIEKRESI